MNLDLLHRKLIAASKSNPPGDQVPYAFEKRVMARVRSRPMLDQWAQWAAALWRAAVPCLGVMIFFSALSLFAPHSTPASSDLVQDMDNAVLAAVYPEAPTDSVW
jgi:hypothetical protein